MPGMMDTVLNLGLNDQSVEGLGKQTGSARFAWDSYRRLLQMYGKTVMGVEGDRFEEALEQAKEAKGVRNDVELDEGDLRGLVAQYKAIISAETGREFPQDPTEQLTGGIEAVFGSWDNRRAVDYRRQEQDRRRARHGGQHPGHGVRQPWRGLRHRGCLHPQPGQRRPGPLWGLSGQRPG